MSQLVNNSEALSMRNIGKAILGLNAASIVRTLRSGVKAGKHALAEGYCAVDPFGAHERERMPVERIPSTTLREALGEIPSIELDLRWADVDGSTPVDDIVAILTLARAQQPEAVLEFGTFFGSATLNLAKNLPNAVIHTIDLPPDPTEAAALTNGQPVDDFHLIASRQLGKAFRDTPYSDRVVQHLGDTARYDYSVIRERLSFFLIDGSHTYEYAKSDSLHSFALAQGRSTFCWHDCDVSHPGVTKWLDELLDAGLPVRRLIGTRVAYLIMDAEQLRPAQIVSAAA